MIVSFVLLASSEKSSLLPKQEGSMDMLGLCRTLYGTAWEYGFVVRNMAEEILEFGSVKSLICNYKRKKVKDVERKSVCRKKIWKLH